METTLLRIATFAQMNWKKVLSSIWPKHAQIFWRMVLFSLVIMTILRIIFYAVHHVAFANIGLTDWLAGAWFDCITICIAYLPFALLHFLPLPHRSNKIYRTFSFLYFLLANSILIILNLVDVEYFKYTGKRSTIDLLNMVSTGNDMNQLIGTFISQFWWLILLFILFVFGLFWTFRKVNLTEDKMTLKDFLPHFVVMIISVTLVVLVGRGGWGLRPVGIIETAQYTKPSNTAFVLNTGFTMVKSFGAEQLEEQYFFTEEECKKLFNPIKKSKPANYLSDNSNVVIIILESFGNEWVAFNNPLLKKSYTPFLDSLATQSLYFENAYANGKKSIEAVPSIVSSIPSLMNNPYISSPYGNNKIKSLANILSDKGYSTSFFHAATNGSMRFDGFAAQAGFENYYGRFEYNNDEHFDKTWGILDEYFNPWAAKEMTKLRAPFFSTLFTISSHHPYFIPENRKKNVIKGPQPICASISYGDYSLKKFFEEAKKQPWYNNTIFVICADHTPSTNSPIFSQRQEMYKIPMLFFDPSGKLPRGKRTEIFQQLDILPSLLDLLNFEDEYYAFGNSVFQKSPREAITYLEGTYHYFNEPFMLSFTGNEARNLYDLNQKKEFSAEEIKISKTKMKQKENRLKAIIQRYNFDLIHNQSSTK